MQVKGKHYCWVCEREFDYTVSIRESRSGMEFVDMSVPQATGAFIGKTEMQLDARCPHCNRLNRFSAHIGKTY